ncbi:MAG: hypothetical protein RIQ89_899 [Bacteroidota bacterium]
MACGSGGSCGSSGSGCNKLNVYDWLTGMGPAAGHYPEIVEVRFKNSRKEFFKNKDNLPLQTGDIVAVEGNPGHDIGTISMASDLVKYQMKKKGIAPDSEQVKTIYRLAKPADIEKWEQVKALEDKVLHKSREIIIALKLSMKLSDIEFQGDGKKATFFYTADDRVDFRELIKKLADEFKIRIEMRQIGMRQEAARLGGLGSCGRELCCSSFLSDFKTVSTGAARYQNLALNPAKLAGQCGKLKCCLNYELDTYVDALKEIPSPETTLHTAKGKASHRKTDIFKRMMWFAYDFKQDDGEKRDFSIETEWVPLHVNRVKEIMNLNAQQVKPTDLRGDDHDELEVEEPDYENVVGQDRIDRLDKKKKKKKKKKKPGLTANTSAPTPSNDSKPSPPQRQHPPRDKSNNERRSPQNTIVPKPAPQGKPNDPNRSHNRPPRQRPQAPNNDQPA